TEERAELTDRVQRLEGSLEAERSSVPEEDLAVYEKMKKRVGGYPIALAKGGSCSVCGMAIPGSKAQRVRTGSEVVRCEGCGRMLYQG
ncbi:MAG: C4-type zinc ribbon domain-containing protein, partial [Anaerolineales bacterium]|nr:C4-type zinc ribbon domain-containing protein [Anaerolineales bacterium]